MKASEFLPEDITASGDVAVVVAPMSTIKRRMPLDSFSDKYSNRKKKRKSNARRRS